MNHGLRHSAVVVALSLLLALGVGTGSTATGSLSQGKPSVVLLTGFCTSTDLACGPFRRAVERTGVRGRILSPDPREDPKAVLAVLARQGHGLILIDPNFADFVAPVAKRFPKQPFAILDVPHAEVPGRPRGLRSIILRTHEASYLAGWLAARLERPSPGRDAVAAIGGWPIPQVDDFIVGFRAGVKAGAPGVSALTAYSRDFADPAKCDALARQQIARGAGVVFNVAGGCGFGTLEAAKRAKIWGIGVDFDQSDLGQHILTSVVKGYEAAFFTLLTEVRSGRLRTGITTELGLRQGGADLAPISRRVPRNLVKELERVRARILSGDIRVPGSF